LKTHNFTKNHLIWFLLLGVSTHVYSQTLHRQGKFYIYWGWNRAGYLDTDIKFTGEKYNFTLSDVEAKDKPTPKSFQTYFNPKYFTIPQYNYRIGYYLNDKYQISIGMDHMKYVVTQNQEVGIDGYILKEEGVYNGVYDRKQIVLSEDFLKFEHTDGLNYANIEIRRDDHLWGIKNVALNLTTGIGAGMMIPRSDVTLMTKPRNDAFHVAGYGTGLLVGLQALFFNHFFIQSEMKLGYIRMMDIRTSPYNEDKAKQSIRYGQMAVVFGYLFGGKSIKNQEEK